MTEAIITALELALSLLSVSPFVYFCMLLAG